MRLSKKLEIGIATCAFLKGRQIPISAIDLAKEVGTSKDFLQQILRGLNQSQLVCVKRGPGGGYVLNLEKLPMTAMDVAMSQGEGFAGITPLNGESAIDKLSVNILEAFLRTTI